MVEVDGKLHKSIEEAAKALKVHPKTLRSYIGEKIVPEPPTTPNGINNRRYFPDELITEYRNRLHAMREAKRKSA